MFITHCLNRQMNFSHSFIVIQGFMYGRDRPFLPFIHLLKSISRPQNDY